MVEAGRKKALGNPILYATTDKFLTVFGLNSLEELPPLEARPEDEAEAAQQVLQLDNIIEAKEN